ncbi:hypothetical protein HQ403_00710 [Candidatus Kaiserbacteria bacterium]|nr:hypothetical protein [Candidatus Kaiserbacteria bacterium]
MSTQTIALGGVIAIALAGTGTYMAQSRIEICHATSSEENPWNVITVSEKAWPAHEAHGDKSPVPAGGCDAVEAPPTTPPTPGGTF